MAKQLMEGERKDKMRYVKLGEITVEDRAREDYGDLEELMESIKEKGVIQPITLALKEDGTLKLLAGGRRYESSLRLGLPTIPAIVREGEDDVTELEIELIENVHRKELLTNLAFGSRTEECPVRQHDRHAPTLRKRSRAAHMACSSSRAPRC